MSQIRHVLELVLLTKDLRRPLEEAHCKFILPPEYSKFDDDGNEIPGGRERRRKVKEFAL
jgi:hypothetical protein